MYFGNVVTVRVGGYRIVATLNEGGMSTPKNKGLSESRDLSVSVAEQGKDLARKAIAKKYEIADDAEPLGYGCISSDAYVYIF